MRHCLHTLQPEHCYSGFEVGNGGFNIFGAYEADTLERQCADHLYGMDIDHPADMCLHRFRVHKDDPRIDMAAIDYEPGPHNPDGEPALWIRLGELDLHPVECGVPELLAKASALIRPIRCDGLNLLTLAAWDDDPNPRFDFDSARRWMSRFDPDSDWPDAQRRHVNGSVHRANVPGGQPCPEAGWWFTPARPDSYRYFSQGEIMPSLDGDYGHTFWQWSPNQVSPNE